MEIIVRDGKYFTIGDNGAEFFAYRKGDVIFSAEQSEQILEKGKITHGKRRGKALVDGTAFVEGTAFRLGSGSSGGGTTSSSKKKKSGGGSKKGSGKKGGSKKSSSKGDKTTIDWIEIDLKRAEREVKNLQNAADDAFKTFEQRTSSLKREISAVTGEIQLQKRAYNGYIKAAGKVKLSNALKKKVRDGSIEIGKYNSDTQKKIKEYQDLYEKSLKAKDSINELKETISKLFKQNFDNIVKRWENSLSKLEYASERISTSIENRTKKASDYTSSDNKIKSSNTNVRDYKSLIDNAISQVSQRTKEIAQLQSALNGAVKSGAVSYGSEQYYDMLKEIMSAQKEVDKLNSNIIDHTNAIAEEYRNIFDQVATNAENKFSIIEHFSSAFNNRIELAEAKGLATSVSYYKALQDISRSNYADSVNLVNRLQKNLNASIASKSITIGSQAWHEMTQRINEAKEATDEATISIQNYSNQMRQIEWDRFDSLQEKISDVVDETEFLIDLMSDGKLFNENGSFSDTGLATLGLHTMNYDVYTNQAKEYANEILEINKLIANDPNNLVLLNRRKELLEAQRESILSAQEEKQSIKSLVEDGIKDEISYMDELIDKYLDALNSQKDLYDYQKKVNDQTDKIASLQKQLSAYSGDNSEEAKQRVQKIQSSLNDARDNLKDMEYDKYVSDSKKMLDDLKSDFQENMNARLDDIDGLISDVISIVDEQSSNIMSTLEEQSDLVGYTMTDSITNVWSSASTVLTSTNEMISNIHDVLLRIWQYAESTASNSIRNVNNDNANKNSSEKAAEKAAQTTAKKVQTAQKVASQKTTAPVASAKQTTTKKTTTTTAAQNKKLSANYTGMYNDGGKYYYYSGGKKKTGWIGKRYFRIKDGLMITGENKIGKNWYYFDKKTGILKTGRFTVGNKTYETDKNGIIKKRSVSVSTKPKSGISVTSRYASGSKNILRDKLGWTNERGQELLYRNNSGAILTPLQSGDKVFTKDMADNLWDMSRPDGLKNLVNNIVHGKGLSDSYTMIRSGLSSLGQTNVNQNFDNITFNFPNVTDYDSMVRQMQSDKRFEKLVQSMTIGRINGKPKDMKRHIYI